MFILIFICREKKHRSRSRSYEREYPKKLPNDGKYYSDRYKEEKGIDRYYNKDDKFRSKDDDGGKYGKERKDKMGMGKDEDNNKHNNNRGRKSKENDYY